ncbi:MAG TPA: hypothetical protein PLG78_18720 [Leptospiraceae bacterium]|nr:hypothetical protein [Leptospiraceae bacterium]
MPSVSTSIPRRDRSSFQANVLSRWLRFTFALIPGLLTSCLTWSVTETLKEKKPEYLKFDEPPAYYAGIPYADEKRSGLIGLFEVRGTTGFYKYKVNIEFSRRDEPVIWSDATVDPGPPFPYHKLTNEKIIENPFILCDSGYLLDLRPIASTDFAFPNSLIQNAEPVLSARVAIEGSALYAEVKTGRGTKTYSLNVKAAKDSDGLTALRETPQVPASLQWKEVDIIELPAKERTFVFSKRGPMFVSVEPRDFRGKFLFIQSYYQRSRHIYEMWPALLYPFAIAVDLVTSPIQIPLLLALKDCGRCFD